MVKSVFNSMKSNPSPTNCKNWLSKIRWLKILGNLFSNWFFRLVAVRNWTMLQQPNIPACFQSHPSLNLHRQRPRPRLAIISHFSLSLSLSLSLRKKRNLLLLFAINGCQRFIKILINGFDWLMRWSWRGYVVIQRQRRNESIHWC